MNGTPQGYGEPGSQYSQDMASRSSPSSMDTRKVDVGGGYYQWEQLNSATGQWERIGQPIPYQTTNTGANAYTAPGSANTVTNPTTGQTFGPNMTVTNPPAYNVNNLPISDKLITERRDFTGARGQRDVETGLLPTVSGYRGVPNIDRYMKETGDRYIPAEVSLGGGITGQGYIEMSTRQFIYQKFFSGQDTRAMYGVQTPTTVTPNIDWNKPAGKGYMPDTTTMRQYAVPIHTNIRSGLIFAPGAVRATSSFFDNVKKSWDEWDIFGVKAYEKVKAEREAKFTAGTLTRSDFPAGPYQEFEYEKFLESKGRGRIISLPQAIGEKITSQVYDLTYGKPRGVGVGGTPPELSASWIVGKTAGAGFEFFTGPMPLLLKGPSGLGYTKDMLSLGVGPGTAGAVAKKVNIEIGGGAWTGPNTYTMGRNTYMVTRNMDIPYKPVERPFINTNAKALNPASVMTREGRHAIMMEQGAVFDVNEFGMTTAKFLDVQTARYVMSNVMREVGSLQNIETSAIIENTGRVITSHMGGETEVQLMGAREEYYMMRGIQEGKSYETMHYHPTEEGLNPSMPSFQDYTSNIDLKYVYKQPFRETIITEKGISVYSKPESVLESGIRARMQMKFFDIVYTGALDKTLQTNPYTGKMLRIISDSYIQYHNEKYANQIDVFNLNELEESATMVGNYLSNKLFEREARSKKETIVELPPEAYNIFNTRMQNKMKPAIKSIYRGSGTVQVYEPRSNVPDRLSWYDDSSTVTIKRGRAAYIKEYMQELETGTALMPVQKEWPAYQQLYRDVQRMGMPDSAMRYAKMNSKRSAYEQFSRELTGQSSRYGVMSSLATRQNTIFDVSSRLASIQDTVMKSIQNTTTRQGTDQGVKNIRETMSIQNITQLQDQFQESRTLSMPPLLNLTMPGYGGYVNPERAIGRAYRIPLINPYTMKLEKVKYKSKRRKK